MGEKILLLSGPFGEGHKQAAQALLETCKLARPDAESVLIDFMEWTLPRLHGISKAVFHRGIQAFPSVYGYLYQHTKKVKPTGSLHVRLRWYGMRRIVKLLEDVAPTVVVSTFPSAAAAVSDLKMAGLTDIPAVTVITDHTDHRFWVHPGTDLYVVGSEKVRRGLIALGVEECRIKVTGIPIRPTFDPRSSPRRDIRHKLGLDAHKPVLLLMGGGYGMMHDGMIRLMRGAAQSGQVQVVVICGHNQKLRSRLEADLDDEVRRNTIQLTGFVTNMEQYMSASDLVVTKAGGLTTSEAIAMRLPMVLYRPLPGQEEDNADFLTKANVAIRATDDTQLERLVMTLLARPGRLAAMRRHMDQLHMERASFRALEEIFAARSAPAAQWRATAVRVGL
ncbi:MAG: ugtP [Paenibacillus sp.]|nr:ugtP [Paenibacillus sp.]